MLLAKNLAAIMQLTENLTETRWRWKPDPNEWCLLEVLAHVRASADLNQYRIFGILAVDEPVFPTIHPRLEWQMIVPYTQLSSEKSLLVYRLQREELLLSLQALDEAGWNRTGAWDGRTHSIYLIARTMALHEPEHFDQIRMLVEQSGQ